MLIISVHDDNSCEVTELTFCRMSDISVADGGLNFACSTLVSGSTSGIITTWDLATGTNQVKEENMRVGLDEDGVLLIMINDNNSFII